MTGDRIPKTYSLSKSTVQAIEAIARLTYRSQSAIIDMAIELLASQDEFSGLQQPITQSTTIKPKRGKPAKQIQPSAIPGVRRGLPEAA